LAKRNKEQGFSGDEAMTHQLQQAWASAAVEQDYARTIMGPLQNCLVILQ
jgi:hypothetical protein